MLKRLSSVLIGLILISLFAVNVSAASNTIHEITMDVFIQEDGSAIITETWNASLVAGTEGFKPYGKMGDCAIIDFSVSDETGVTYETISRWKSEASMQAKREKCGIVYTSSGIELCWGIGDYGDRSYTLHYTITNFVKQYKDAQGVYFSLMPKEMDQSPGSVRIFIHTIEPLDRENADIWAYGYTGEIIFSDGGIVLDSQGRLRENQYMVALIKFEESWFSTTSLDSHTFDEIYAEATPSEDSGSPYVPAHKTLTYYIHSIFAEIWMYLAIAFMVFMMLAPVILIKLRRNNSEYLTCYNIDIKQTKVFPELLRAAVKQPRTPINFHIDYYRELPCEGDLEVAAWMLLDYKVLSLKIGASEVIGAYVLTLIQKGHIQVVQVPGMLGTNYAMQILNVAKTLSMSEGTLLRYLREAADNRGLLTAKRFKQWCGLYYQDLYKWLDAVSGRGLQQLRQAGYVSSRSFDIPNKGWHRIGGKTHYMHATIYDPAVTEETINILGFRKFLLDFSVLYQREAMEVIAWEDYLIFAQLLGIADKVAKQLEHFVTLSKETTRFAEMSFSTSFVSEISDAGYSSAVSSRNCAERAARASSDNSSGDGGSSSSSGGDSASGSSSGGGFR